MGFFARVVDEVVVEVTPDLGDFSPEDVFEPDIAAGFLPCPPEVRPGWVFDGKKWSEPADVPARSLDQLKMILKASVDAAAENERLKYITAGAGQALTYMQKADEARRYLSEDNPDPANYPLLSAEVGITAPDTRLVAETVSQAFILWQQVGAAIEATRLGTKAAIESSQSEDDAHAAFDLLQWPR